MHFTVLRNMKRYINLWLIISISILGLPSSYSRKYDIEAESQKLYGEDLRSVLRRFRKTPEYLSILEAKLNDLKLSMEYIAANIQGYYEAKLNERVEEIIGANQSFVEETNRLVSRDRFSFYRRQSEVSEAPVNMTGIERLDSYKKLRSTLSVEERNKLKDIGFEFAGHVIHSIIEAVHGEDGFHPSTLQLYGPNDKNRSTTHQHQVTHTSTAIAEEVNTTEGHELHTRPPESFRNFQAQSIS